MVNKTYKCLWHKAASVALALTLVVTGLSPLAKTYAAASEKATSLEISNPVTVLHLGDKYDLNFDMEPFNNTEKTYWKSSNTAIADVDSSGKFTAKKLGVVRITAYTKSGLKSTCEILVVSKYGVTGSQRRVDRMLESDHCRSIYIKNVKTADTYTIEEGRYLGKTLYVEAPLSEVENYGKFKKVTIVDVADGTFNEYAYGNTFVIKDKELSFNVDKDASVKSMSVVNEETKLNLTVEGKLNNLTVSAPSTTLNIAGTGNVSNVVVSEKAKDATLNVSVPTAITLNTSAKVVLSKEAKGTEIVASGEATKVEVVNNTGATVTVVNDTTGKSEVVKPEDGKEEVVTPGGSTGGSGGGSTTPSDSTEEVLGKYNSSTKVATYELPVSISNLKSALVMVDMNRDNKFEKTYSINNDLIKYIDKLLSNVNGYVTLWSTVEGFTLKKQIGDLTIEISDLTEKNTRKVTFDGVTYTVTVTPNGDATSITLKKDGGVNTYTLGKSGTTKLIISCDKDQNFYQYVKFKVTY